MCNENIGIECGFSHFVITKTRIYDVSQLILNIYFTTSNTYVILQGFYDEFVDLSKKIGFRSNLFNSW